MTIPAITYRIHGTLRASSGAALPAGGVSVDVADLRMGGEYRFGTAELNHDGTFELIYEPDAVREHPGASLDPVVRVVDAGGAVVARSEPCFDAGSDELIDVAVPAGVVAVPDEFTRLVTSVGAAVGVVPAMADLVEAGQRRDVTFAAAKSGWHPWAVALAGEAERVAAETDIPAPLHYALYRAGLPGGAQLWSQTSPRVIHEVWRKALDDNIISPELAGDLTTHLDAARELMARAVLNLPTGVGTDKMADLLREVLPGDDDRLRFARIYSEHRDEPDVLWSAVDAVFPAQSARLRLDGELAELTGNNVVLINQLRSVLPSHRVGDLALAGYHHTNSWRTALTADVPLPEHIPPGSDDERRDLYADSLATALRSRHLTAVVAAEIADGSMPMTAAETAPAVADFLAAHHDRLNLATDPIDNYLAAEDVGIEPRVRDEIAAVQRVLAVAATPEAARALRTLGFDSAQAIVDYAEAAFVEEFAHQIGGTDAARTTSRNAQQVHMATLATAASYLSGRSAPEVWAIPSSRVLGQTSEAALPATNLAGPSRLADAAPGIRALPNLETLFGVADSGSCPDCESVLSPAAYLVDLLNFLDVKSPGASPADPTALKVLLDRRPDIQHIALSCENTEIELPHVDLANEILEYLVVNPSITGYRGHDVSPGTTTEDLLGTPQFVADAAFEQLRTSYYPMVLPWDRKLTALRTYLTQAGTSLADAMAVLRPDDGAGRSRRDVMRERLGIAPADREVLCGSTVTPHELFGNDRGAVTDDQLLAGAGRARTLIGRLEITPSDLISVLGTRFLNPDAALARKLLPLRIPLSSVKALKDGTVTAAQFTGSLPPGLDPAPFNNDVVGWIRSNYDRIMNVIVLTDPTGQEPITGDSSGGFATMELRRALPDVGRNRLRPVDLLKFARFVRLKNALRWDISQTDAALTALWTDPVTPTDSAADLRRKLDSGFEAVLHRVGQLKIVADLLGVSFDDELPWLLGLVAPLGSDGPASPYARLFVGSAHLGSGVAPNPPQLLRHAATLQAALKLTDADFVAACGAAGIVTDTPLTAATVSSVFRYGYLARALGVPVVDLVDLIAAAGLAPFASLDADDSDLVKLIRLTRTITSTDLPVARVVQLCTRSAEGDQSSAHATMARLRAALQEPPAPPSNGWTDGALRGLLTTVHSPAVADQFLTMLSGTTTYTAAARLTPSTLPAAVLTIAPALAYDSVRSMLVHRGVLLPRLAAAVASAAGAPTGLAAGVAELAGAGQVDTAAVRADSTLEAAWQQWTSSPADPADPTDQRRRAALGATLLSGLRPAVLRRRLCEELAPILEIGVGAVSALISDPAAVPGAGSAPISDDLLAAVTTAGFSATFGTVATPEVVPAVDFTETTLRAAAGAGSGPVSGAFRAVVTPPLSGSYEFTVDTDASGVELTVGGAAIPVRSTAGAFSAGPVSLTAGTPVTVALSVTRARARLVMRWSAAGGPAVVLPGSLCTPVHLAELFTSSLTRLQAAAQLCDAATLTPEEFLGIAGAARYRVDGVGWLATVGAKPRPETSAAGIRGIEALAQYAALRKRWSVGDAAVVGLLSAGAELGTTIGALTGTAADVVSAAAAHLGIDFASAHTVEELSQLADVLDLCQALAAPVSTLATALRTTPATGDVEAIRAAVQARYDRPAWNSVVRPLNNELRKRSRDALVGKVLAVKYPNPDKPGSPASTAVAAGFITPENLYEELLLDVQMDPCMTTSRIAQAISTAQLFASRVLLNLESRVPADTIDAQRWQVMKRFRVWQASRRIFLYPENWLDPELRDDKSPFFTELESSLLQSDITDEAAASALGHYLEQLDEVAKLEIAGMYVSESPTATDLSDPLVHVVGRTAGSKRTYWHRTFDGTWMPWRPVDVDIPNDPVLPVLWRGRLLLFWLQVMKQPDPAPNRPFTASGDTRFGDITVGNINTTATASIAASLFWTEFYNGRWQSARTSDPDRPINLGPQFAVLGDPQPFKLASATISNSGADRIKNSLGVVILNPYSATGNSSFRLYTTHSLPVRKQDEDPNVVGSLGFTAQLQVPPSGAFFIKYSDGGFQLRTLLQNVPYPYRAVVPMHQLRQPRRAPFFFQDSQHVFYVHPDIVPMGPGTFGEFPEPLSPEIAFVDLSPSRSNHG